MAEDPFRMLFRDKNLDAENPFSRRSLPLESDPCLHAKRIIVVGNPVKIDTSSSAQRSDQISIRSWLEKAPPLNRFKVPVEAERLIDNDLVLEQYLSPASPLLAGFRIDGFSAIRPRVTHSPSSHHINTSSSFVWEDRLISAAVLYVQVSVLQVLSLSSNHIS